MMLKSSTHSQLERPFKDVSPLAVRWPEWLVWVRRVNPLLADALVHPGPVRCSQCCWLCAERRDG